MTLLSRSPFVNAPPHALNRLITVGNNKKNKAKIIGPKNPCKRAQSLGCLCNSAPKAGQNTPRLYKLVTKVAIIALGTTQAKVRAKKSKFPMIRFVTRRDLGILRFFHRISPGRGARKIEAPCGWYLLEPWATVWAEGMVG